MYLFSWDGPHHLQFGTVPMDRLMYRVCFRGYGVLWRFEIARPKGTRGRGGSLEDLVFVFWSSSTYIHENPWLPLSLPQGLTRIPYTRVIFCVLSIFGQFCLARFPRFEQLSGKNGLSKKKFTGNEGYTPAPQPSGNKAQTKA